jgi:calcineurin-like phosphoesterase family protein
VERWITADLHLGHANINRYCGRPFSSAEEMNEAIVDAWNQMVAPTDRVLILGDLALGPITESLAVSARLRGQKILLAGNHDRCAALHGKDIRGWVERYRREGGIQEIHQGQMRVDLDARHRQILACHFPYRGDSGPDLRYAEQRPLDTGEWLLHGHVHEKWRQADRQINVGIDAWGGTLANTKELVALIDAGPRDVPRIPWSRSGGSTIGIPSQAPGSGGRANQIYPSGHSAVERERMR